MSESVGTKAFVTFVGITGVLAMVLGVIFIWQGITEGWPHTVAFGIVGLVGLPIVLAGVLIASRCPFNLGRSFGRSFTVAGTLAIGTLAAVMWWTIIGPVVALAIISFWAVQFLQWAQGRRITVRQ